MRLSLQRANQILSDLDLSAPGAAIAIDHQPRIVLCDQRRIECPYDQVSDSQGADVPIDVPLELGRWQSQISKTLGEAPAGVIDHDHEYGSPVSSLLKDRVRLAGIE